MSPQGSGVRPVSVSGVIPGSVTVAGGPISVVGQNFPDGASVTVGGLACTVVVVVTSQLITCVAPVLAVGLWPIIVAGALGPNLEVTLL